MERKEAFAAGLRTYNTGRPCKRGHPPERYTNSGICVECAKANSTKYNRKFFTKQRADALGVDVTLRVPLEHVAMMQELAAGLMAQHNAARESALEVSVYNANVANVGRAYADRVRAEWCAERGLAPPGTTVP